MSDFFSTFTPEEKAEFDNCQTSAEIAAFTQQVLQNHLAKEQGQARDAAGRFASDAATAKAAATAAAQKAALEAAAAQKVLDDAALHAELVEARKAAPRNIANEVYQQSLLAEQFRSGAITPEAYMHATGAIEAAVEKRLQSAGFDIDLAAGQQLEQRWIESAQEFQRQNPDFPFGEKNKELMAMEIQTLGLVDTADRVGAMNKAYQNLKNRGLLFEADVTQEEMKKLTDNATPEELLAAWKESVTGQSSGDPSAEANTAFISAFQNGRSSGLWGK